MIDQQTTEKFLTRLFGASWGPMHLAVCSLRTCNKGEAPVTRWATTASAAAKIAAAEAASKNVYLGMCLRRADAPEALDTRPGKVADVVMMPGVWLDVDVKSPHRTDQAVPLPEDEDEALDMIEALEIKPTALVRSGYGFQPHWLFPSPVNVTTESARVRVSQLSEAFTRRAQRIAKHMGYHLDSKHSLATILRMPGTVNRKGEPRPVELVSADGPTYTMEALEAMLGADLAAVMSEAKPAESGKGGATVSPINAKTDAQPPADKLAALICNNAKFKRTWERERTDLRDQTQSGYDMALACFAAAVEWTDQEIADLLIAHARQGRREIKRAGYYERTIQRAKSIVSEKQANETTSVEIEEAVAAGPDTALALVRETLGLPVTGYVQRGNEKPQYYLVLEGDREVCLGTAKSVLSISAVRSCVYSATRDVLQVRKQKVWDDIVRALSAIVKVVDIPEADRRKETTSWIVFRTEEVGVLPDRTVSEDDEQKSYRQKVIDKLPFRSGERIAINSTDLYKWLRTSEMSSISIEEVRVRLSELGFTSEVVQVKKDGRMFRRSYWLGAFNPGGNNEQ